MNIELEEQFEELEELSVFEGNLQKTLDSLKNGGTCHNFYKLKEKRVLGKHNKRNWKSYRPDQHK